MKHIPRKKNTIVDIISCYLKEDRWEPPNKLEEDLNSFINNTIIYLILVGIYSLGINYYSTKVFNIY